MERLKSMWSTASKALKIFIIAAVAIIIFALVNNWITQFGVTTTRSYRADCKVDCKDC